MPSATPSHLSDEDFINKSLLASLDAQADADPEPNDDDTHDADTNITRYAIPRHHAPDDHQDQYHSFSHSNGVDNFFQGHQGLYSSQNQHMHQDFPAEYIHNPHHQPGPQQAQPPALKPNGFPGASNYRNSFTAYPNTTRPRHLGNQSALAGASSYREQGSAFYPSQEGFPGGQVTSPVMQQYNPYDYSSHSQQTPQQLQQHQQQQQAHQQQQQQPVVNGVHKSPYLLETYSSSKPPAQQQQQPPQAPTQGQPYPFSNGIGIQLSSQTPYGPHVPAGVAIGGPPSSNANSINGNVGIPPGLTTSVSIGMVNGNGPTTTANGEEISTIFVVGFPEDMQEREFQNMFTFSPGFEAATLKIPHKEFNAYNPLLNGSGTGNGMGGAASAQPAGRGYGGNDPYNIVSVNQGSGVADPGRDGITSWPSASQGDDLSSHYTVGGMGINPLNGLNPLTSLNSLNPLTSQAQAQAAQSALSLALPPRKQIIGFAKFRSREEALVARDVLQGRRVDIEKGAVLKAEMAKKNLHTKRGVGLVGGVGQAGGVNPQGTSGPHTSGSLDNIGFLPESALARINHWPRENGPSLSGQPGSVGASSMAFSHSLEGLTINGINGNVNANSSTEEEGRKRDSVGIGAMGLTNLNAIANGVVRGAREREEEERERRRRSEREREINLMRLRATNSAAFDAFHGVAPTVNGASTNGTGVTSPVNGNGINGAAGATSMSRQSSAASSGSLWGSPAMASSATGNNVDGPAQQGQAQDTLALPTDGQQQDSPLNGDDNADNRAHHQQIQQQLDDEDEEFERRQMERDRIEEEQAMQREYHEQLQQEHAQTHGPQIPEDAAIGPWDRGHSVTSYASVARPAYLVGGGSAGSTINASAQSQGHPSSSSERSTSPGFDQHGPGQRQGGYIPQFQHLQYHHEQQKQLQLQRQSQQFQSVQQVAQHVQNNYRTQSESSETSAIDVSPATHPAGYIGAAPMLPLGVHTNGTVDRLQQQASSSSSSTSASVSTSTSTSMSVLASSASSAFASSVSSSSSTSAATTSGSVNGTGAGSVSPLPPSTGVASASSSAPGSTGNTSPQLPSPAGSGGSGSTTSLRGTVDQNPPINTLYVGNLPTSPPPLGYPNDYLEETLREVFSARPGYRKLCFRHKANGPMCFVEFEDVQHATKALTEMSGNTLRGVVKNGIRLSYSKNPLGVRTTNGSSGQTSGSSTPQTQQFGQAVPQYGHGSQSQQSSGDSFLGRDDFAGPQHRLPMSILRRDSTLSPTSPTSPTYMGNGNGNPNSFFSSPPPRFFTANSPTGTTQLTSASTAFVPRSAANGAGVFAGYAATGSGFSPFGLSFGSNDQQRDSFGAAMLHQHPSYTQQAMSESQHPQPQQSQQQADE